MKIGDLLSKSRSAGRRERAGAVWGKWRVACGTVTCHDPVVQAKQKTDDALCTRTSERMWKTAYEHV